MRMKSEQSEGNPTRWIHGGNQERPEELAMLDSCEFQYEEASQYWGSKESQKSSEGS